MTNQLEQLLEFKQILANYHISEESKQILDKTQLALMVAPTASGRNTVIKELMKTGKYHFIVSDTTRRPRVNDCVPEKNGVEYWFRSEEEVLDDLRTGKFLEAAIIHNQQVSGISIRELEIARDEGKIAITDIEVVGVHNIMQAKPDTTAIFVLPPSFEEWMSRMDARGNMNIDEKRRRLQSALHELESALNNDYFEFIVNDTIAHAVEQVHALTHRQISKNEQADDKKLAEQLISDTTSWLKQSK